MRSKLTRKEGRSRYSLCWGTFQRQDDSRWCRDKVGRSAAWTTRMPALLVFLVSQLLRSWHLPCTICKSGRPVSRTYLRFKEGSISQRMMHEKQARKDIGHYAHDCSWTMMSRNKTDPCPPTISQVQVMRFIGGKRTLGQIKHVLHVSSWFQD